MNLIIDFSRRVFDRFSQLVPEWLIAILARWSLAYTFWSSGRTKVSGLLEITDSTYFLFEHEYALPLIPYQLAAHLATYAEHLFPVLLTLGLFSRFAALSLLIMTAVIQIFVYPDAWTVHMWWAVALLYLIKHGPGLLSVDHLISRR